MAIAQSPQQGDEVPTGAETPAPPASSSPFRRWTYTSLPWLRPVALLALLATFTSRVLTPALKGGGVLSTEWVNRVEFAGNALAQLLLFALLTLLLSLALAVLQTPSLSLPFRLTFTALGGLALGLGAPASGAVLGARLLGVLATSTALMALLAAGQVLVHGPIRTAGLVLALFGTGALTRQGAWLLAAGYARAPATYLVSARVVATAAFALQALAVLVALVWLATRRGRPFGLGTSLAMGASAALTSVAAAAGAGRGGPWASVIGTGLYHLLQSPAPLVALSLRHFVALLGPALAATAALGRGRPASVRAALALMLVGGTDADVPLCALCLVVASLALVLAAFEGEPGREPGASWPARRAG
ncbi:MAG TPA: hypothetical protein VFS43_00735 [Polyangiaceae bacterium]|nr:hypothetical protein [Polyangiaceae bacterium]